MLAGTVLEGKGRDRYKTILATAFILRLRWKRLIVRSGCELSLLVVLARDATNLVGVESHRKR